MALGSNSTYSNQQNSNGNNGKGLQNSTFYSRLRLMNSEGKSIGFSFWNGLLRISFTEYKDNKTNEIEKILLSPTKARSFLDGVNAIYNDKDCSEIFGIDSGSGDVRDLIVIGRDGTTRDPYIIMAKVNSNGTFGSEPSRYNFSKDYTYLLHFSSIENLEYQKSFNNDIELEQFKNLLEDFARSSNGAYGYSVNDINRYEAARLTNLIKGDSGNSNRSSSSGFFSKNSSNDSYYNPSATKDNSSHKKYTNIDDLEEELG